MGLPPGMKPYENDEEKALKKGADKSNDTFDRRDQIPGGDITVMPEYFICSLCVCVDAHSLVDKLFAHGLCTGR